MAPLSSENRKKISFALESFKFIQRDGIWKPTPKKEVHNSRIVGFQLILYLVRII